jgi:bifunctional enzyme CysN/CysC
VIAFDPYGDNRELGGFILIDRQSHATVACGTLEFALQRSNNIHWQHVDVDKHIRSLSKGQRALCVWFTGLSGAGKSTIANLLERRLLSLGYHTYLLDGDNVRHGLNKDLGFTEEARIENVRRMAEVAHLMVDAGLIVLVCAISPFRSDRRSARECFEDGEFVEVFVDTPLAECEQRDSKGLYAKARAGELSNFTGIDSPYEIPQAPDEHLLTSGVRPDQLADALAERILARLQAGPQAN